MKTTRHKPLSCPTCEYTMDASTCVSDEDASPSPGDISLCFNCGEILEYDENLDLVEITADTLLSMSYDDRANLTNIQAKIRRIHNIVDTTIH